MYTEIMKIIEGGLRGDREKVHNYAEVLADNLEKIGEVAYAKKIKSVIAGRRGMLTSLDGFASKPVDVESRMDIVEIAYPTFDLDTIVLGKYLQDEINGFVEAYKKRDCLSKYGIDIPSSLLLYGPPGCGKTTIANYVAFLLGLPLVTARLDGMVSSLLGSTAKNIRKIFEFSSKKECVLFLDEFDVVAKFRDDKNELGELKRVVNSLLQNIDDLGNNTVLIAATNHHTLLDPAVWRRFSAIVSLGPPNNAERVELIRLLLKNIPNEILDQEKRIKLLENALSSCSHSAIKTIILNAARNVVVTEKGRVTLCDILKEILLHNQHNVDEESLVNFLINNGATQKEIHDHTGASLRTIQVISNSNRQQLQESQK